MSDTSAGQRHGENRCVEDDLTELFARDLANQHGIVGALEMVDMQCIHACNRGAAIEAEAWAGIRKAIKRLAN